MHATSASSALELAVGKHLTLSPQIPCYKIATRLNGPLSPKRVGMFGKNQFNISRIYCMTNNYR